MAYRRVLDRKRDGVTLTEWRRELANEAELFTGNHHHPVLDLAECKSIGDSIARWTWRTFTAGQFAEIQGRRGRKSKRRPVANSARSLKPWEAEGVHRSTWYRRRKKAEPVRLTARVSIAGTGASAVTVAQAKPWEAKGISRRTWYRRKARDRVTLPDATG